MKHLRLGPIIKHPAENSNMENSLRKMKKVLDKWKGLEYYMQVGCETANTEQYRSGHNGHDWKSCVPQKGTEGSNPSCSARKKEAMRKHRFFFN